MSKIAGQQIGTQLVFYLCITLRVYCIWEDGNRGTWYTVTDDGGIRTVNKGCRPAGFSRSSGWFIMRSREEAERAAGFQLQWQAVLHWLLQHAATKNQQRNFAVEKHLASLWADRQVVIVAIWWVIEITTCHNHIQQHRTFFKSYSGLIISFTGPRRLVRDPVCVFCACDLHTLSLLLSCFPP